MPMDPEKLKYLAQAYRRLAIVGRYNAAKGAVESVFLGNQPGQSVDGPVGSASFFSKMQPEIRATLGEATTIGTEMFNRFKLGTPLDLPDGKPIPLAPDSPLFDEGYGLKNDWKAMQSKGAELFKKLLAALDSLAHFSHGNFHKALLKLAKNYVPIASKVDMNAWYDALGDDHPLCAALVHYLTCYAPDEQAVQRQLKTRLAAAKIAGLNGEQVEAVTSAILSLKQTLLSKDKKDEILGQVRTQDEFINPVCWFDDYPASKEFGIGQVPGVENKSFAAHFGSYMAASREVNRIVRCGPLHPYLICWLWSKYRAHDQGATTFQPATAAVFRVGVEGRKDRVPAESNEARKRNDYLIRNVEAELDLHEAEKRRILADKNYVTQANIQEDRCMAALRAPRCFTTPDLAARVTGLFVGLGQLAGGKVEDLQSTTDQARKRLLKFYFEIMNLKPSPEEGLTLAWFKQELSKVCNDDTEVPAGKVYLVETANEKTRYFINESAFVQEIFGRVKSVEVEEPLRIAIKEAFVEEFGRICKSCFGTGWALNVGEIDSQAADLERLYRFRLDGQVNSAHTNGGAGAALMVTAGVNLPDIDKEDAAAKSARRQRSAQKALNARPRPLAKSLVSVTTPVPKQFEKLPAGAKGSIKLSGTTAANIVRHGNNLLFEIHRPEDITASDATIVFERPQGNATENDAFDTPVNVVALGIPELASIVEHEELRKQILTEDVYARSNDVLGEVQNALHLKFSDPTATELQQKLRALLLGEHILAAPTGSVPLDRDDISCGIGLMIDMVEHLGVMRLGEKLYMCEPNEELSNALTRINISRYFPVADASQLATVMQWTYQQGAEVLAIKGYLQEIQEIARFLDSTGPNLDIVLINSSLNEHNATLKKKTIWPAEPTLQAGAVYFTAHASGALLKNMDKDKDEYLEWRNFCAHYKRFISNRNAPHLICPVVFSPVPLPADKLPLVSPDNVTELPDLYPPDGPEEGTWVHVQPCIQRSPFLLLAATFLDPRLELGKVQQVPSETNDILGPVLGLKTNQTIGSFLAQLIKTHKVLASQWTLARWVTMALLARGSGYSSDFGTCVVELLAESKVWESASGGWAKSLPVLKILDSSGNPTPVSETGAACPVSNPLGCRPAKDIPGDDFNVPQLVGVEWRHTFNTAF